MKRAIYILLMLTLMLSAASVGYDKVYELYKKGEYTQALKGFKNLAQKNNDFEAAYMVAYMYEHGEGCNRDQRSAQKWYKISADGYYKQYKHSVDKELMENRDLLFSSIEPIDDAETRDTIYQYVHSIFNLKAYKTNYLLPLSVRLNGNYNAENNYGVEAGRRDSFKAEVEFQISVKYDFLPDLFGLKEVYTVAYTQHSFWQYYVGDAYFRENNYNPEFYVTFPLETYYFKALRFSVAHESNGQGVPYERSWNYLTCSTYIQYGELFTELQMWYRMDSNYDYNPNLIDTMGHGHIKFMLPYKKHMTTLLVRNNFHGKGAFDASYSYPLFGKSLFLYIKGFVGYGESLIEYAGDGRVPSSDHFVEKLGIGFSLSR